MGVVERDAGVREQASVRGRLAEFVYTVFVLVLVLFFFGELQCVCILKSEICTYHILR